MLKLSILIFSGLLAACTTSPTGRSQLRFVPDSQLTQLGGQAYEKLKQQTAAKQPPAPPARQTQTIFDAAAKSAVRAIGSELGRQIIRGVLGSILGKRR